MTGLPVAVRRTGLVTSVGLSAPAACAAIRAKVTNPSETRFIDSFGERIMAHQVPLEKSWRVTTKLARIGAMAITECLEGISKTEWSSIPVLLCVAEHERPGRLTGLDGRLLLDIQQELETKFAIDSSIVAFGRVSGGIALAQARKLIYEHGRSHVVIAGVDSLLTWPTLSAYDREDRLLSSRNSNGFMPGEGCGALLLGRPNGMSELQCVGIGFGIEKAHIDSGEPLRAEGLVVAINGALADAGCKMHELDYRITDLSGEQYYFKEAVLALGRTLRRQKEEFDIWHPAECTGECGAATTATMLAVADAACRKGYGAGANILAHMGNDAGQRVAIVLQFGSR